MRLWLQCAACWNSTAYDVEALTVDAGLGVDCGCCKRVQPCIAVLLVRDKAPKDYREMFAACRVEELPFRGSNT